MSIVQKLADGKSNLGQRGARYDGIIFSNLKFEIEWIAKIPQYFLIVHCINLFKLLLPNLYGSLIYR